MFRAPAGVLPETARTWEKMTATRDNQQGGKVGRIAYALRALGKNDLPGTITVNDKLYTHEQTIKHDFFAATGFYRDEQGGRAVLKMGRTTRFAGVPLKWIGRWLCR